MHMRSISLLAGILLLGVFLAGCTSSPPPAPAATPAPATMPATTAAPATAATTSPDDAPVDTLPPAQLIHLELTKERPTSSIILTYQGGPGDVFTNKVEMRVYTSPTEYKDYVMTGGRKPLAADQIIAPGTRGKDRVLVYVTSAGNRYKVIDETVAAGTY